MDRPPSDGEKHVSGDPERRGDLARQDRRGESRRDRTARSCGQNWAFGNGCAVNELREDRGGMVWLFKLLTSSPMRALYLRQVNLRAGRSREEQAHECIAEDDGNFVDGSIEHSVAIAHERSPWKTTHDDLRFAVEPASGGCDRRGVLPCPLTIYAARVPVVRAEAGQSAPRR